MADQTKEIALPEPTEALPELTHGEHFHLMRSARLVKAKELYMVQFQLHADEEKLQCSWSPSGAGTICT